MAITARSQSGPTNAAARGVHREPSLCRLDEWLCMRQIFEGRMYRVYAARPEGRPVGWPLDYVIKVLQPKFQNNRLAVQSLQREATLGQSVRQQHLIPVLTSRLDKPPYYVVYPRAPGRMLAHCIGRNRPLSTPMALWIVRQTTEALRALHQLRWRHGDIKPENIIVGLNGHVTLIDLGCAQQFHTSQSAMAPVFQGSLHYVAPECLSSRLAHDGRSDIYSLGILLFECLTGIKPFEDVLPRTLIDAHRRIPPPDLRHIAPYVPSQVARIVHCMLAKDPLRRPQTADELIDQLISVEIETITDHVASVT